MPNKKCTGAAAILLAAAILFAAALCGAAYAASLNAADSDNLKTYINTSLERGKTDIAKLFQSEAANHFKITVCALFCSLNIYTFGIFALYYAMHGFAFGFSAAFAAKYYSANSAALIIGSAVISCVFTLPVYVFLFVIALKYALNRAGTKYIMSPKEKRGAFLKFAVICTVIYTLLCIASIFEALLNSLLSYLAA